MEDVTTSEPTFERTVGVTASSADGPNQPQVDPRLLAWRLAEDGVSPETRRTVLAHQSDESREAVEQLLEAWEVELADDPVGG